MRRILSFKEFYRALRERFRARFATTMIMTLLSAALIMSLSNDAFAFKLPDSDQTKCYQKGDPYTEIPCAGTGQDGAYIVNPLSYTDNGDSTVTDNNTGLMWQKEDDGNTYNWYQASGTYNETDNPSSKNVCGELRTGDYSDWRLPSMKELVTIVDYAIPSLSLNPIFTTTFASNLFWSSTIAAGFSGSAWLVSFFDGSVFPDSESIDLSVRCVRGGQLDFGDFLDNSNGTITDTSTGLVWQQDDTGPTTWDSALEYCEGLDLAQKTDWRLPNIKELMSLTDDTRSFPALDTAYFPKAEWDFYWTSTSDAFDPSTSWSVNFLDGLLIHLWKSPDSAFVRCVRGLVASPSSLAARAKSSTSISLSWKDTSDIETGFRIDRKLGICSSANPWAEIGTKPANMTTYSDPGLSPGTIYAYRVKTYNSGSDSAYSDCVSVKTALKGIPKAPTHLKAVSASKTKVNLSWTDNSSNETGLEIYKKTGAGEWTLLTTRPADAVTYGDTAAAGNDSATTYSYYVKACNAKGCSSSTARALVPFKPTSFSATAVSPTQINLLWKDNSSNETGFQVYRKEGDCSSTNAWTLVNATERNVILFDNTGLIPETRYSYKVMAYRKSASAPFAIGYAMYSNCDGATTH